MGKWSDARPISHRAVLQKGGVDPHPFTDAAVVQLGVRADLAALADAGLAFDNRPRQDAGIGADHRVR